MPRAQRVLKNMYACHLIVTVSVNFSAFFNTAGGSSTFLLLSLRLQPPTRHLSKNRSSSPFPTLEQVEQFVEEQLSEARFFVQNVVALRAFQTHRSARIIQKAERRRAELARRSAAVIVRATRCWLARGSLRRVRIRRGIRRYDR